MMMTANHNYGNGAHHENNNDDDNDDDDDDDNNDDHDHDGDDVYSDDDGDYLAMITDESPGSSTAKSRMKSKGSMNCLPHHCSFMIKKGR